MNRNDEYISQSFNWFIGEVLDVTGHLGGFNFQWAWASGYVAGEVIQISDNLHTLRIEKYILNNHFWIIEWIEMN